MDQSFLDHLKGLKDYDQDLLDKLTNGTSPVDLRIENMEEGTIGFKAVFQVNKYW